MKLIIRESAWAIISENAEQWNEEYRKELGIKEVVVDLLYCNWCYDLANRAAGSPIPLDEVTILLDRFWAKRNELAKQDDFRERVKSIVSRYDDIVFESADSNNEPEQDKKAKPSSGGKAEHRPENRGECYGHGTRVEVLTPYVLRINVLDGKRVIDRILLDPVQATKLVANLEAALKKYESKHGKIK